MKQQEQLRLHQERILYLEEKPPEMTDSEKKVREECSKIIFANTKTQDRSGFIYAYADRDDLANFRIKIGMTARKDASHRKREHNCSHGVKNEYLVCLPVDDAELAEWMIHRVLNRYNSINSDREYFRLSEEAAIALVHDAKNVVDDLFKKSDSAVQNTRNKFISGELKLNIEASEEEPEPPQIEQDKVDLLLIKIDALLKNAEFRLIKHDKFEKFIKDTIGHEFKAIKKELSQRKIINCKDTGKCYKVMKSVILK